MSDTEVAVSADDVTGHDHPPGECFTCLLKSLLDADTRPAAGKLGAPLREVDGYRIDVLPMLYNARVTYGPVDHPWGYDHGWCYATHEAAVLAVMAWDPDTEDEPAGWHKRATRGARQAPRRDPDAAANAPRCEHGARPGAACQPCALESGRKRGVH